jgi:hypothetical protein
MVKKSLHRFYILGLALVATLFFFGAKPDHYIKQKPGKPVLTETTYSIHSTCPCHQPFEIENKEEQPSTEDDETRESSAATLSENSFSFLFVQELPELANNLSLSKSQTEYHTPAYVRMRSILI